MVLLQDREAVLAHFRELKGEMTASRDLERFALVLPSIANTTKNILSPANTTSINTVAPFSGSPQREDGGRRLETRLHK